MIRHVVWLALPIWVSCGGPCDVCLQVSSTYDETMAITNANDSSCNTIYSNGNKSRLVVKQDGNRVKVFFGKDPVTGVLNADDSLQIDAFPGVATAPDGGSEIPLSLLLSGVFAGEKGTRTFDGVYQATAKTIDCVTRVRTRWVEVQ